MNVTNTIKGVVNATKYTVTAPIIKEDYGLYLKIEGLDLPAVYEVDFSNSENSGSSVTMVGNADGVLIPRQFIKSGQDVFAFLYWNGEDFGRTVYKFRIPNKLRPDRTEEQPTPEEQSLIDQAISALNSAVEQTAADVETTTAKAAEATAAAHTATQKALEATESAQSAGTYATRAETAQRAAETARTASQQSATASATSAEQAAGSALTASTKAGEASASASAAAQSAIDARDYKDAANLFAESASGYAGAASESATSASESASTATTKASEAAQSATTATAKAGEASASATAAQTAQTAAEAAQTAAETAQGLAEDAQTGAETAQAAAEAAIYTKADGITDTATGAVASFPDGADDFPMKSLKVAINPVQDLHGYDSPWPAGGGKNLVNVQDASGITTQTTIAENLTFLAGTYTLSAYCSNSGSNEVGLRLLTQSGNTTIVTTTTTGSSSPSLIGGTFTLSEDVICRLVVRGSATGYNATVTKVQVESGSTATSYAPYSNICPITGWTGVNVQRTGKNLFDKSVIQNGYIDNTDGQVKGQTALLNYKCTDWIRVSGASQYYVKSVQTVSMWGAWYDKNKAFISGITNYANTVLTAPQSAVYLRLTVRRNDNGDADTFGINYPSTDHDYHPYTGNTYPISWQSEAGTVYGGTLEVVSGELVVDRASVDLGTFNWKLYNVTQGNMFRSTISAMKATPQGGLVPAICSDYRSVIQSQRTNATMSSGDNTHYIDVIDNRYSDVGTFKSAMSSVQFCYELDTPITYHLTPTEVRTLLGQNNVFADTGNSTVEYYADTKRYIDKKIAEIVN